MSTHLTPHSEPCLNLSAAQLLASGEVTTELVRLVVDEDDMQEGKES